MEYPRCNLVFWNDSSMRMDALHWLVLRSGATQAFRVEVGCAHVTMYVCVLQACAN